MNHPVRKKLFPGLTLICLAVLTVLAAAPGSGAKETAETEFFPRGNVFNPLVADPKEPRFFAGIHRFENDIREDFTGAAVGYGETFGLIRGKPARNRAWQLSLRGGIFSHFDMDTSSNNLLNSDYTIGLLWSYRYRDFSLRTRAYHQSSHLGDEYARENPEMLETATGFDYEAVDLLAAWTPDKFRFYGGLHWLVKREPADIDRWGYQYGAEYQGTEQIVPYGVFVAGADIKGYQQLDWTPAYSIKAGINFKNPGRTDHYIQVMAEYYNGFIPYGQYYDYDMKSLGAGIYFGF
ncbi:MAG: DUF1207 domain-containing protein [Desulfosalsimonas sp.]